MTAHVTLAEGTSIPTTPHRTCCECVDDLSKHRAPALLRAILPAVAQPQHGAGGADFGERLGSGWVPMYDAVAGEVWECERWCLDWKPRLTSCTSHQSSQSSHQDRQDGRTSEDAKVGVTARKYLSCDLVALVSKPFLSFRHAHIYPAPLSAIRSLLQPYLHH
ncbi:hypothetical protein Vretimale_2590, partial [Volvox reticuliferus]